MCDQIFQNYAAAINGVDDPNTDLVPTVLLFSGLDCTGTQYPQVGGQGFVTNTFTSGSGVGPIGPSFGGPVPFFVQSFIIPFNFGSARFNDQTGKLSTFIGPFFTTNTNLLSWQNDTNSSMYNVPIYAIRFVTVLDWPSQGVLPMCMGRAQTMGPFALNRYTPTSDRCDTFMSTTWCSANINNEECSCFRELPAIEQKSADLKVDLPVICFGTSCATLRTYKTNGMLSKPCNLTICQQTVNATPGIINAGTDTVFCGGQFYTENGDIAPPSVSPLPSPGGTTTDQGTPFYVWIMLGVSGLLFLVLIYLLFAQRKGTQSSILRQIQKITKNKKSTHNMSAEQGIIQQEPSTEMTSIENPSVDESAWAEPVFDTDVLE